MRCFSRSYRSTFRCQKAWTEETSIWKERAVGLSVSGGCSAMRCELSLPERTYNLCLGLCEREREEQGCWCAEQTQAASLLIPPSTITTRKKYCNWSLFLFLHSPKKRKFQFIDHHYLFTHIFIDWNLLVSVNDAFGARVTWVMCYKTNIIEVIIIVIMIIIISPKSDQWDGACNEPIIINHAV